MTQAIHLRIASKDDLAEIADLRWRLQTDDQANFNPDEKQQFINEFVRVAGDDTDSGSLIHWLAEKDGAAVAVMSIRIVRKVPKPRKYDGHWGYLTNIYTLPDHRNKSIGAALLGKVKEWAKENALEFLIVWPSDASYGFYERAGFASVRDPLILDLE